MHWRRGDFERASQFLNTALDLAATLEDNRFEALCFNALALVQTDLGRHEDAIQAYKNAIHLAPERICPWNNLGSLYKKLGRHAEALTAFQKSIEQDQTDIMGWQGLGHAHHALGRNDEALNAFLKATEISPNLAGAWSGLGQVYHAEGQIEEALAAHQKAIELDHGCTDSWLGLGKIYNGQAKPDSARTAYQTAIELDPRNAHAWAELGQLAFSAGAYDEAMHSYKKAIEFGQGSCQIYRNLASIVTLRGHQEETIPLLKKGITLTESPTESACLWNRLGDSYRQLNDYENAISSYRQADLLNPKSSGSETDLALPGLDESDSFLDNVPEQMEETPAIDPSVSEQNESEVVESDLSGFRDDLPSVEDIDCLPPNEETSFMDWLDGLASVQPVLETPEDMSPIPANIEETAQPKGLEF